MVWGSALAAGEWQMNGGEQHVASLIPVGSKQ